MKKIVLLFLFLVSSLNSFSQNSYFVDKKGARTIMDNESVDVILIDKRITYSVPGKTWEKYIKFEDLDYAVVGSSLLKSFNLNKKKKPDVYFVFAEKDDKKLIGVKITTTYSSTGSSLVSSFNTYKLFVIDNDQNIIEELLDTTTRKDMKNNTYYETNIVSMIKNNFSDCPELISKLEKFDKKTIYEFFSDTTYINCKK